MSYAITHQVIVFSLYAWVALAHDPEQLSNRAFQGWLLANFGGSFTFEICRKLNPNAHQFAGTYAHHYGRPLTMIFCTILMGCMFWGASLCGFSSWMILPLILLQLALINWIKKPLTYKVAEGLATLASLIIVLAPALIWLIKRWNS
jgi:4-hydroxybenzoate polyprenyltransferase